MESRRQRAFTLIEILISVAILGLMVGIIFRPLLMGVEVLSVGRAERQAQRVAQDVVDRLSGELRTAVRVYSNLGTFDLTTGTAAGGKWRTAQTERLSFVPAATDATGRALTPLQPATDGLGRPQVVTYWVMRNALDQPYDPLHNPRRLWRAVSYYNPFVSADPALAGYPVTSPDDIYRYAVRRAQAAGGSLATVGPLMFTDLFQTGAPMEFMVANLDRSYPTPPTAETEQILRSPLPDGYADPYTHAPSLLGISPVTDAGSDVRTANFQPYRQDQEQLQPNRTYTAYRGTLRRWQEPYQRASDGLWTAPATGLVETSTGPKPLLGMFRVQNVRDGNGPLGLNYFLSVDQDPASPTVGHVLLYRMPDAVGGDAVPVYDTTDYPRRVYATAPGTMADPTGGSPHVFSGEMAAGINWETGEILTTFPQEDIICPAGNGNGAVILALNNFDWQSAPPAPPYFSGAPGADQIWQALPLFMGAPDANGSAVDQYTVRGAQRMWSSYTLSAFRPERLQTGGLAVSPLERQLNMSIVPQSLRVTVEKRDAGNLQAAALATRSYQVVESVMPGAPPALQPFQCYADPSTGRLVFYDPQLDRDAFIAHDGYNPPLDLPDEQINGVPVRTVIRVHYEYRNNLPTVAQMLAGNDANRDVVEMTYRSQESIVFALTLDVPADSNSGEGEVIGDPTDAAAPAQERPTGARRRVNLSQRLTVGAR